MVSVLPRQAEVVLELQGHRQVTYIDRGGGILDIAIGKVPIQIVGQMLDRTNELGCNGALEFPPAGLCIL